MSARRVLLALAAVLCLGAAADPADRLADARAEARARGLFQETRCLVCQGQSIDDSDAPLAADLRRVIRVQVAAGRSDGEVRAFLRARYGEFVLFRPPLTVANALLWSAPFLIALGGIGWLVTRRSAREAPQPLSAEEESRLAHLTEEVG